MYIIAIARDTQTKISEKFGPAFATSPFRKLPVVYRRGGRGLLKGTSARVVEQEGGAMLRWALTFLIIALLASLFGMVGLEGAAMEAARILFFVFLVLLVVSLVAGRRLMT